MAEIKPFRGIRPVQKLAQQIASKPYDVLDEKEARKEAEGNPYSFYHVIKPEIDFPDDHDHYSADVYEKGIENFRKLKQENIFIQDEDEYYYIYAQTMNGRTQYGIVARASVEDYFNGVIKKHELTRPDKEEDRKNHIRYSKLNYEPVFFAYPANRKLDEIVSQITSGKPEYEFTTEDNIGHTFWVSRNKNINQSITNEFSKIPATYIADGHHRTAASALVGNEMKEKNSSHTGSENYNYFLAVHFPDNQLAIMDYNRVVKDLNGLSEESFIEKLKEDFEIFGPRNEAVRPDALHVFGLYLANKWYRLKAKSHAYDDNDPIGVLDVTILSQRILEPLLNIRDLRTDKRIQFVGGLRGLKELERRVDSGEMKAAFSLYPVSMKQLIDIANSGQIMPPKTTWFEPKLRSGLVIYSLED